VSRGSKIIPTALLYTQRPTDQQIKLTAGVAALLLLTFVSVLPFRDIRLLELNSYIPAIESLLMLADLITAILLLSQASTARSGALVALGTAYFFSSLAIIPHALTFPGAFSQTGLLGAQLNTSAWLYLFWRPGLPVGAIVYALLKKRSAWPGGWPSPDQVVFLCLAGAALLVVALTVLTTAGDALMPRLLSDSRHWHPTIVLYCALGLLLLDFIAMGLVCRTFRSVLDLWLLLTLFTVAMELTMTGIIWGRFCLGWYVERTLGLFSGLLVLMLLLTETHRLYRQNILRASDRERERERQLLIRDATVAAIAHELRQPLSAILLNAEVGQIKVDAGDNDVHSLFGDIAQASHRASEIIVSTCSLFYSEAVAREPSDMNLILRKSLALIGRNLKEHRISVTLELDEPLPLIPVNRLQMEELFLNLFTNAIDAMGEESAGSRDLVVSCGPRDGDLVITVRDTGPGIPSASMRRIFDPFYTTKKNGTGVGLMICHSIITAHGGWLRVVPEYTAGAAFEIHLPGGGGGGIVEPERPTSSESSDPARRAYPVAAEI
jgi:signal transduction histidine kinase